MENNTTIGLPTKRISDVKESNEPFIVASMKQLSDMAQMKENEIDKLMDEALKAYDEGRIHSQEDAESLF